MSSDSSRRSSGSYTHNGQDDDRSTATGSGILYDMHLHTPLCKHASGSPSEYAAVGYHRGLKGLVFTCHNPTIDGWSPHVRMAIDEFDTYVSMIESARREWADRMDIRLGLESDYVPGMEAWLERLHAMAPLHHVLGSVHPHLLDYRDRYFTGDMDAFVGTYFEHLAMAAETGLFDTIAHPDLVKVVAREAWNPERFLPVIRASFDRIAATGVALELNTSGLLKALAEMNPGRLMLKEAHQRHIPIVLGSDAHQPERVAASFPQALDLLTEVGYTHIAIILDRQRQDLSIDAVRASLSGNDMNAVPSSHR